MDGLCIFLFSLLSVASSSSDWISGSVSELTVRAGDNITLYCDYKIQTGEYIVWFRNCSHQNQPALVLEIAINQKHQISSDPSFLSPLPRYHFMRNYSSKSYDLLIENIINSDEGLYYCGAKQPKVQAGKKVHKQNVYREGNMTTRIQLNSSDMYRANTQDCSVCRILLFSLCLTLPLLSSLLSSVLVYHFCQKRAREPGTDGGRPDCRDITGENGDGDVCYAALKIRQTSQRPKKKKSQSSDSTTYSTINRHRV